MRRLVHCAFSAVLLTLPLTVAAHASGAASTTTTTTHHSTHRSRSHVQESASAKKHISHLQHSTRVATTTSTAHRSSGAHLRRASLTVHRRSFERFYASSFTDQDLTQGDIT